MRLPLLYLLFLLSGAAGLVYEMVWVRELIFVFGGTTYAITTVLVAFMAGLGLGSYFGGRWADRLSRPGLVYGGLEAGIGLYALAVPLLLGLAEPAYRALYPQLEQHPGLLALVRFALSAAVLIVPTTLMGATLPILVRYATLGGRGFGASVGYLYGINTLGAVLGVGAAGFWLLPTLGLTRTTWLAAGANLTIGCIALLLLRQAPSAATGRRKPVTARATAPLGSAARRVLVVGFAVSGLTAMMYQIAWTRALIMSLGSSTYSFTCILAAFILGLALGSLAIARWVDRWGKPLRVFGVLELLIGLAAVVIVPLHGQIPRLMQGLVAAHTDNFDMLLRVEFLLVTAVTIVPTLLLGAIFPLVTRALARGTDDAAAATGRAYAVNTAGTIAGSLLAGFALIRSDTLGVQNTIILASVLNALVGGAALSVGKGKAAGGGLRSILVPGAALLAVLAVGLGAGRWDPRVFTLAPFLNEDWQVEGCQVVYFGEGCDATVAVQHPTDNPDELTLTVNGKPDASTGAADLPTQLLLGHLPALLVEEGRAACVIGLGSGMTLAALARHPSYERLDCVEISAEVVRAAEHFAPFIYDVLHREPRVRLLRADGRNHLLLTDQTYDVIVSEPSNPWMSGVANLFTREFFELGRRRLTERGVMAVWLHSYRMAGRDFQMVIRTLGAVFPHVSLWETSGGDYILLAGNRPPAVNPAEFQRRFETPTVRTDLYRAGLFRPAHVLGRYIASGPPLAAWVADAPLHTDDNALLEFSAPRYVLGRQGPLISAALKSLQQPVLRDLCPADPPATLAAEVNGVVAARGMRLQSEDARAQGDPLAALRFALSGLQADPSSDELARSLNELHGVLTQQGADAPALADVRTQLRRILPPLLAPLRGATLEELAALRRTRARDLAQRGAPGGEAAELLEALRLEPGHVPTALGFLEAMTRAGRGGDTARELDALLADHPADGAACYVGAILAVRASDHDTALARLTVAVRGGTLTPVQLLADERFAALRGDARFNELTQPSGGQ
jgi:spermidine synthase